MIKDKRVFGRPKIKQWKTVNSQLPPWLGIWLWKGLFLNTVHRWDAKNAEFTFFLFSFERKENKNHKPYGKITILLEYMLLIAMLWFLRITRAYIIFFSALLRPVECGAYSSGVSRKKNIHFLCVLCDSAVNYYVFAWPFYPPYFILVSNYLKTLYIWKNPMPLSLQKGRWCRSPPIPNYLTAILTVYLW